MVDNVMYVTKVYFESLLLTVCADWDAFDFCIPVYGKVTNRLDVYRETDSTCSIL
jgi:hypothetical protein